MSRAIAVYGSAGGLDASDLDAAREFGRLLGRNGWGLVFGGGKSGVMGAAADGAYEAGGRIVGVIPAFLYEREGAHERCGRLEITRGLHDRLERMAALSDGFCVMPGGFGTLNELFEAIALRSLGCESKPIVLLNVNGYYDRLIEQFEVMYARRGARESCRECYAVAGTPEEAVGLFKSAWNE